MTTFSNLVHKIVPFAFKNSIKFPHNRGYGRFRTMLFSVMVVIVMGPVIMTAALGYHNYKDLLQKEERDQLESRLDGSIKSVEAMVDNLTSVVLFVARSNSYRELTSGNNLEKLFLRIKHHYGLFADLGVIDQTGVQQAYYGHYGLQGADYSKEPWVSETFETGVTISTVHKGYRNVEHFSIAVAVQDHLSTKHWMLRTTIEVSALQELLSGIKTHIADDIFLVDEKGRTQTASKYFGPILSELGLLLTPGLQQGVSRDGQNIFYAIGEIKNSPWKLVLVEERYIHHQDWTTFRVRLFFIVFTFLCLILVLVYILVTILTDLIRKADEMQMTMLQEAEHTDKLVSIGRLAAGVGHEINNPLAIIDQKTGLAEDLLLITADFEHRETIEHCLKGINESVERCKAITHRLLGFARRADVHNEELQVNDIIREVMLFLENSMMHSRIQIDLQLQDNLPTISSDHLQLQQVFLNITNNAIDAIGKDGTISILTHLAAGEVQVVIQDNGHGIESATLPHIFEPFFTTKETGKGTGLGLSITYGLTKKLGGDITVRSQIGKGTAFTITLPLESEKHDRTRQK